MSQTVKELKSLRFPQRLSGATVSHYKCRNWLANARVADTPCPYRPPILSLMYSLTLRRTAGGRFGDERIRLMTPADGPTLLSRLSTTQAVARCIPRTASGSAGQAWHSSLQNKVRNDCYHFATEFGARRWYELARGRTRNRNSVDKSTQASTERN